MSISYTKSTLISQRRFSITTYQSFDKLRTASTNYQIASLGRRDVMNSIEIRYNESMEPMTVQAVYKKGVLKPVKKLNLPENSLVVLKVVSARKAKKKRAPSLT